MNPVYDTRKKTLKSIYFDNKTFFHQLKPGILVRFKPKTNRGLVQFYEKEAVLSRFKVEPKLNPKQKQSWGIPFWEYRLIGKTWDWYSIIMLLGDRPTFIALPVDDRMPTVGYCQIWPALWNGKTGFIKIELELDQILSDFLEILNDRVG